MVAYLARIELRRRWRHLVLVAVLVAVVVGTVLTAVAGARRASTSVDRYVAAMQPPDVAVFGADPETLDEVAALPHVETSARVDLAAIVPSERPSDEFYPMMVSLDGQVPYRLLRPKVVAGRLPDPGEALEVALGERAARRLGKGVGDALPMAGYTPEGVLAEFQGEGEGGLPAPDGPAFDLEVVGIVRDVGDLIGRESDLTITFLTPAFRARYPRHVIGELGAGAFVVLDDPGSLNAFAEAAEPLGVDVDTGFVPTAARGQANPTVEAIAVALYVFSAVAAVAGAVAIAQALGRGLHPAAADLGTLHALGLTRAGRWAGTFLPRAAALVVGLVGGVLLAIAASPTMPVGLARRAEPDPGIDVDVLALALGGGAALVSLTGLAAAVTAAAARGVRPARPRTPSRLARMAAEAGAGPATSVGLSFASAARSPSASASRAALGGVVFGVTGIVAAAVFASSVDRLVASPDLYGWGWDANLAGADLSHLPDDAVDVDRVLADDDLTAVAEVLFQVPARVDGEPTHLQVVDDLKGRVGTVMVRGRPPAGPGEVALAGQTAAAVDRGVGDVVTVDLGHGPEELTVTGVVALPVSTDGGASSRGGLLSAAAATHLGFEGCESDPTCYRNLAVVVRGGADPANVLARHTSEAARVTADLPQPPGEVERLTAVERLPWFLAGVLALLATFAVVHAATSLVRRRRHDLAVLRVLGFTARQVRAAVATQVAALTVLGATVGAVLGVVVGRVAWRTIVDGIPLPYAPAVPIGAVVLVAIATLALAEVAAARPGRAAARLRTADVLRSE